MGCFNSSGFISKLPIKCGDRVVCFIGKVNKGSARELYYPDSLVAPIFLPIRGYYDDYGSVENIDRTPIVDMIERCANGTPIEQILEGIERCVYGDSIEDNIKYWADARDDMAKHNGREAYINGYNKTINMHIAVLPLFVDKSYDSFLKHLSVLQGENELPEGLKEFSNRLAKEKHSAVLMLEHEEIYDKITENFRRPKYDVFDRDAEIRYNTFMEFVKDVINIQKKNEGLNDVIPSPFNDNFHLFSFISVPQFVEDEEAWKAFHDKAAVSVPLFSQAKSFSLFHSLSDEEKITLYTDCEVELRRFYNLYDKFARAPMYFTFSQTAGMQYYNYTLIKDIYDACNNKLEKDIAEESDEYDEDD